MSHLIKLPGNTHFWAKLAHLGQVTYHAKNAMNFHPSGKPMGQAQIESEITYSGFYQKMILRGPVTS